MTQHLAALFLLSALFVVAKAIGKNQPIRQRVMARK